MATASWAYHPAQHPWFKMASLKRRHSSEDDDSDQARTSPPLTSLPTNRAKRRRCSVLERGFATLNLNSNPLSSITVEEIPPPAVPPAQIYQSEPDAGFGTPTPMDTDAPPFGTPQFARAGVQGSVEEPTSPDAASMTLPDVKMHTSSWYEAEKDSKDPLAGTPLARSALLHASGIVVTDLDASSDEESSRPHTPEPEVVISPAVMESLRRGAAQPMPVTTRRDLESKALVLFKPLGAPPEGPMSPPLPPPPSSRKDQSAQSTILSSSSSLPDVDAMDVE